MHLPWLIAYFFAGAFAGNAIPHLVAGMQGRAFQSPFATPPGKGLSSARLNVVWGCFNLVIAWLLLARVGDFDWRAISDIAPFGLGLLLIGLILAHRFGPLHGGDLRG